jgi:hypothetical protein
VTHINQKLGLKPAGQRSMMKLPADRVLRNRVTSAVCPGCQRTGANLSKLKAGWLVCSWCNTAWELPGE